MESVELVEVKTQGTKELNELGQALKTLITKTQEALKDGFQAGEDIPAILMGSYQDLTKAIQAIEKVGGEIKAEPVKAIMGALIPVSEGVEGLLSKDEGSEE